MQFLNHDTSPGRHHVNSPGGGLDITLSSLSFPCFPKFSLYLNVHRRWRSNCCVDFVRIWTHNLLRQTGCLIDAWLVCIWPFESGCAGHKDNDYAQFVLKMLTIKFHHFPFHQTEKFEIITETVSAALEETGLRRKSCTQRSVTSTSAGQSGPASIRLCASFVQLCFFMRPNGSWHKVRQTGHAGRRFCTRTELSSQGLI